MQNLYLFKVIILSPIAFICLVLPIFYIFFLNNVFTGGEDFSTSRKVAKKIASILKSNYTENGNILDMGSCRGDFTICIKQHIKDLNVTGIDNSGFRVYFSKLNAFLFRQKVKFILGDFFEHDLRPYNIIYLYVPQEILPKIEAKILKQCKHGTVVVTYRVSLNRLKLKEVHDSEKQPSLFDLFFHLYNKEREKVYFYIV
ncbi:MAG: class I SAM-dependent methyltransferase [bacterium]|nr:class I SAM-dependent methyltransferase [bacterium]